MTTAERASDRGASARPRGRLLRKYALILAVLVAGALVVAGAVQIWFSAAEQEDALVRIQREKAASAASAIEQFVAGIEGQLGWTTHASVYAGPGGAERRRFDFIRLLRQAEPITELVYIDRDGKEQLRVSGGVSGMRSAAASTGRVNRHSEAPRNKARGGDRCTSAEDSGPS